MEPTQQPPAEAEAEAEAEVWPQRLNDPGYFDVRACIYGPPGSGKTTLAATAPRPFFWMVDPEGALAIAESGHLWWELNNMDDLRACWNWSVANLDEYDTVVLDTVSHLQDIGMDEIVPASQLSMDRKIYGKSGRQMRSIVLGLTLFPKDVIYLCGERLRDDEINHLKKIVPDITPAPRRKLMRVCRIIGRLSIEIVQVEKQNTLKRMLQVCDNGRVQGKDTRGVLEPFIWEPNMTEIFNTVRAPLVGPTGRLEDAPTNQATPATLVSEPET